jgi:CDP-glycerol glycerophosphotransferase (TagB/SpsB family)
MDSAESIQAHPQKTIAISLPFGMSVRNFLCNKGFTETLLKSCRVIVFSPFSEDSSFQAAHAHHDISFEKLQYQTSLWGRIIRKLVDPINTWKFTRQTKIETITIFKNWLQHEKPVLYFFRYLLSITFGIPPLYQLINYFHARNFVSRDIIEKLKKHQVDLVFITHLHNLADQQVAMCAKELKIPLVGMPHSWDNLTSKSGIRQGTNHEPGRTIPFKLDKVIVWNEILKQELIDFYGYDEKDISISGIPQFDAYADKDRLMPRNTFCQKLGLDPSRKIILYAAGSPQYMLYQDQIIEILVNIVHDNDLHQPAQLLIRHHPNEKAIQTLSHLESKYREDPHVIFHKPSSMYTALVDVTWNDSEDDVFELANMIHASDVIVTMTSTIFLDSSAFDKPVVNLAFDGYEKAPYFSSIRKCLDFTHIKKIVPIGAFRTTWGIEELKNEINRYLDNPNMESKERRTLVERECFRCDGQSAKRIAEFLIDYANRVPPLKS